MMATAAMGAELAMSSAALAARLDVPDDALYLAAHARVCRDFQGGDAAAFFLPPSGAPQPRLLDAAVDTSTWRSLVQGAAAALASGPPPDGAAPEVVLDLSAAQPCGEPAGLPYSFVRFAVSEAGQMTASVRAAAGTGLAAAARLAGYHLTALRLLTESLDHPARDGDLLGQDERDWQLGELAGNNAVLPGGLVHELIEQQARDRPADIAARCGDRAWTYDQLNRKANRLAHALLARGMADGKAVGVLTERNLDWLACTLAVLKTGAVYCPIEPGFPPERIADMVRRSGCCAVLTAPGTANRAAGAQTVLDIEELAASGLSDDNPRLPVARDQACYIFFTSGSTGVPKAAVCAHGGMLNHIIAKIRDLGLGPDSVLAETAPQCFDISIWQLFATLMVGGQTAIVPQADLMDPPRFAALLREARVTVIQLVPSYLDVLLSYLDDGQVSLPDLRRASVTGEALGAGLARRWFAAFPDVPLVNAYGLTETSDDTCHFVLSEPPAGDRVPLGRPIPNVRAYVVDERLRLVPLGAAGELAFGGVCVGLGYLNDPERTAEVFTRDPFRPGEPLYRSGDYGRWREDGTLEFLGRHDGQVKIRGHRVEIGEVEERARACPGVTHATVIVRRTGTGESRLASFVTGPPATPLASVRDRLAQALPGYMVPAEFYWIDAVPLTANGKVDRRVLAGLSESSASGPRQPGETAVVAGSATERRLARAWGQVLGMDESRIGLHDDFFAIGGSSLGALRLAVAVDGLTATDLARWPVLADLATALDRRTAGGAMLLTPLPVTVPGARSTLIAVPYAGGSILAYLALARELAGDAIRVVGVDHRRPGERSLAVEAMADVVASEVVAADLELPVLWGHSSGVALAIATAFELQARKHPAGAVVAAAHRLGDVAEYRLARQEHADADPAVLLDSLRSELIEGGMGPLTDRDGGALLAAYRADAVAAADYFAARLAAPPAERVHCPVVVAAAAAEGGVQPDELKRWAMLAYTVEAKSLPDCGHYFVHSHPAESAKIVRTLLARA